MWKGEKHLLDLYPFLPGQNLARSLGSRLRHRRLYRGDLGVSAPDVTCAPTMEKPEGVGATCSVESFAIRVSSTLWESPRSSTTFFTVSRVAICRTMMS